MTILSALVTNPSVAMASLIAEKATLLGLNQRQFADRVGMSPKHVNTVFNGRVTADPKTLSEWARLLGCEFSISLESLVD